jgi:hypothetical protein
VLRLQPLFKGQGNLFLVLDDQDVQPAVP